MCFYKMTCRLQASVKCTTMWPALFSCCSAFETVLPLAMKVWSQGINEKLCDHIQNVMAWGSPLCRWVCVHSYRKCFIKIHYSLLLLLKSTGMKYASCEMHSMYLHDIHIYAYMCMHVSIQKCIHAVRYCICVCLHACRQELVFLFS